MNLLKTYGRYVAALLIILGCASLIAGAIGLFSVRSALIWNEDETRFISVRVTSPLAANLLLNAGIPLYPQDVIVISGESVPPDERIPSGGDVILAYQPAYQVTLTGSGGEIRFYSSAPNLGRALWEQGIILTAGDTLSLDMETPLDEPLQGYLEKGEEVTITIGGEKVRVTTAAKTVGTALLDAGIALQKLDYSRPDDSQSIPKNREIEVVRVREETLLEDAEIPFSVERIADTDMNIGEQEILQEGRNGTLTTVFRVRYEDDTETERVEEYEWVSRYPVAQQIAYGSNVVVQTLPEGLNYWLAKEVQIYSYKDTGQPTATGVWPYYGVIAVSPEWFSILRGSNIFVPGYGVGTVLDVCPGCSGKDWIDVFIPTDDYVPWNKRETVYFLTPVPSGFSGDLP
jgi:uncharacterized protein YabE (DUF348 family)/3D (Asp-Asp-Asp) domain-containing protein